MVGAAPCLVTDWYHHCKRHRDDSMWVGALLDWMNTNWFQSRRIMSGSRLATGGKKLLSYSIDEIGSCGSGPGSLSLFSAFL